MKSYCVAVLGATGAVGREMISILEERGFPVGELRLLASTRSAGSAVMFRGAPVTVREVRKDSFAGVDLVLGAAGNDVARCFAPHIIEAGAVFVDNSSAFRLDPQVPLVVPEINPDDAARHRGIIANPNCTTIITLVALHALARLSPLVSITASSYQAVSGAGARGPIELAKQTAAFAAGGGTQPCVFPHQIAYNVIPQIGSFDEGGYTSEEMKLQNEGRKILAHADLKASCTCVRVPVMRCHSVSAAVATERPLSVDEARAAIAAAPGCRLVDDPGAARYPMPLDAEGQDLVLVGRVRRDLTNPNGLLLWCCGDQVRKGAATNAVQIAELVIQR